MELEGRILKSVRQRTADGRLQAELAKMGFRGRAFERLALEVLRRLGVPVTTPRAHEEPAPPTDFAHHAAQDYQSLLMHLEAVRLLRGDPLLVARALETLTRWRMTADVRSVSLLDEWTRILTETEWDAAVAPDERGNQLRQASPLAGLLPEKTRLGIIRKVRALKDFDEVDEVLGDLPLGSKLMFLFQAKGSLGGKTPLEALACGQVSVVKNTAAAFADRR